MRFFCVVCIYQYNESEKLVSDCTSLKTASRELDPQSVSFGFHPCDVEGCDMWMLSWSVRSTSALGRENEHHRITVSHSSRQSKHQTQHIPALKQPIKAAQLIFSGQTLYLNFWTNTQQSMGVSTRGAIRSCSGYKKKNVQGWFGKGCCLPGAEEEEEEQDEKSSFSCFFPIRSFKVAKIVQPVPVHVLITKTITRTVFFSIHMLMYIVIF